MHKILQIVDTTEAGGVEMMAIRIANRLNNQQIENHLLVTRRLGGLEKYLTSGTKLTCLNRKRRISLLALTNSIKLVYNNRIDVIHAHSGSIYIGILIKIFCPWVVLLWHDHYGNSEFIDDRRLQFPVLIRFFANGAIAVNDVLKSYLLSKIKIKYVELIPNFFDFPDPSEIIKFLNTDNFNILMVANFRKQKNHFLALEVFSRLALEISNTKLTLIFAGKIVEEEYYNEVLEVIKMKEINVKIITDANDVSNLIKAADICILTSSSEGMPLAIIEYAAYAKSIVCTAVGDTPKIFTNGKDILLSPPNNVDKFLLNIKKLIKNKNLMASMGREAFLTSKNAFSSNNFDEKYKSLLNTISA